MSLHRIRGGADRSEGVVLGLCRGSTVCSAHDSRDDALRIMPPPTLRNFFSLHGVQFIGVGVELHSLALPYITTTTTNNTPKITSNKLHILHLLGYILLSVVVSAKPGTLQNILFWLGIIRHSKVEWSWVMLAMSVQAKLYTVR